MIDSGSSRGFINDGRTARVLFLSCFFMYMLTQLGRMDYAACMVDIIDNRGWSMSGAGAVAMGFFATYGFGQILCGFAGDHVPPKYMIGTGVLFAGLINLAFPFVSGLWECTVLWSLNGFVQAMIWSPMIRLLSEWMPPSRRVKSCVNINASVPVGTVATYCISAALVSVGNWELVFLVSGVAMVAISAVWFRNMRMVESRLADSCTECGDCTGSCGHRTESMWKIAMAGAMPALVLAVFIQGILKDGITLWTPTFLGNVFTMESSAAILMTAIIPLMNLGGVYLASFLNSRMFRNEAGTSTILYVAGTLMLFLLMLGYQQSAVSTLVLITLITTLMMGIATLITSVMPSYFVKYGMCSTVAGLMNAFMCIGSSVASYANGFVAEGFGWNVLMAFWFASAVIGTAVCALTVKPWKLFCRNGCGRIS